MTFRNLRAIASFAAMALLTLSTLSTFALPTHNVPIGLATATDQGRVNANTELNLTVVLTLHNRAQFDKAVEALYDPASATFRQWFTDKDFEKYAPTAQEFETVRSELVKQGFTVVSSDPHRLSIRVHGTAATVEKAFQTELHNFTYQGRSFRAHVNDAKLTGAANDLIDSVSGIELHQSRPQLSTVKNPKTGEPASRRLVKTEQSLADFKGSLTDEPLSVAEPELWASGGFGAYFDGTLYGANGKTAAFTPAQLEAHYGLTSVIQAGYNGAGQTIALVEAYGYPQAETDANTAATLFGLPALTSSNFSVVYPEGEPIDPGAAALTGWDVEIALDIQSSHSIAPGAKILVVASAGQDNEDQINSLSYIITNKLANAVSSSWENDDEIIAGPLEEEAFNTVLETGAAAGISFQFSSGDGGDLGLGTPVGAVGVPSNSPYATAVGGTSVLNDPYESAHIVTGWGNNIVYLVDGVVLDPLEGYYFGGSGGGQSQYFAKPAWQSALPGSWRQVPDVSALADPYTGFPIIFTQDSVQYGAVYGGTSLASPIFTATWAIADQYNGAALGQAAQILPKLNAGEITDVVPPPASITRYNPIGLLTDGVTETSLSSLQIYTEAENLDDFPNLLTLYSQTQFVSTVWPGAYGYSPSIYDVAVSFGTDSSLTVTKGWDNVTGWGEPNGLPFIQGVTGKTTGAPLIAKEE
jgi:subtilase family serine protease